MNFYKQKLELSALAAEELILAIHDWLEEKVVLPEPGAQRMTAAQALSVRHLHKLGEKLSRKAVAAAQKGKSKPLALSLSFEEIIAVRICITCRPGEFLLQQLLGQIQQRSLNFEYLVSMN